MGYVHVEICWLEYKVNIPVGINIVCQPSGRGHAGLLCNPSEPLSFGSIPRLFANSTTSVTDDALATHRTQRSIRAQLCGSSDYMRECSALSDVEADSCPAPRENLSSLSAMRMSIAFSASFQTDDDFARYCPWTLSKLQTTRDSFLTPR